MSEANFKIIFRGPSVDAGDIDVRDLAPTLLALGDLFQAASDRLNGDRVKTSVRVKATERGCFKVDLSILQTIKEAMTAMFAFADANKDGIAAANDLADLILKSGTIIGVPVGGLIALLKWLKGRKPDKLEKLEDGSVQIQIGDTYFITNEKTVVLAETPSVRDHVRKFTSVLKNAGITSIATKQDGEREELITDADVSAFDLPQLDDEELADDIRNMTLQIISLSFKDDNKWRVTDGGEPFSAAIDDEDFLKRVANSDISFAKGDYLVCRVRERQTNTANGLKKERTIIQVIDHRPAARQLRLV